MEGEIIRKYQIIVSLTSYPKRIENVDRVIKTLLIQTLKPDKIILWLSEKEFPQKEKNLPEKLLQLCRYGLIIKWVSEDLKSHKKYYYAVQKYENDPIITVDDDMYYHPELIEILYDSFLRHPKSVSCMRTNLICTYSDKILPYVYWTKNYMDVEDEEIMDLLPVGAGGILYPPGCFDLERLCNIKDIKKYCLFQDDLWLKVNELLNNVSTVVAKGALKTGASFPIDEMQECALFKSINVKGNDVALEGLDDYLKKSNTTFYELAFLKSNTIANKLKSRNELANKFSNAIINDKCIYLYGAGEGAKSTFGYLRMLKLDCYVKGFLVTNTKGNPDMLFDIPIIPIGEFMDFEYLILITTAEKKQKEIINNLKSRGCQKIVSVTDCIIKQYNDLIVKSKKIGEAFLSSCNVICI